LGLEVLQVNCVDWRCRVRLRVVLFAVAGLFAMVGAGTVLLGQKPVPTECTLTGRGSFSLGWVETQKDQRYRCVAIFDASLQRTGIAWVRVDAEGRLQVP
jgi:hypothetical protein